MGWSLKQFGHNQRIFSSNMLLRFLAVHNCNSVSIFLFKIFSYLYLFFYKFYRHSLTFCYFLGCKRIIFKFHHFKQKSQVSIYIISFVETRYFLCTILNVWHLSESLRHNSILMLTWLNWALGCTIISFSLSDPYSHEKILSSMINSFIIIKSPSQW